MARIRWRGKDVNHVSIGKDKLYDATTVQGGVDVVTTAADAASDNPYLITVDSGYYLEAVQIADVTDLSILGMPGSVLIRDNTIQTDPGGTLNIGNAAFDTTERIRIENLHVVNKRTGEESTAEGYPPEGAIFVGEEGTYPASGNAWDDIIIRGCLIEGVHDGLQLFGQDRNGGANTTAPGRVYVQDNVIRCVHDAVTTKGRMRGWSSANQIYMNSDGIAPYLTNVADWKSTGYHHNVTLGGGDNEGTGLWWSAGDQFYLEGGDNIGSNYFTAILLYNGGKIGSVPMKHRFVGTTIRLNYDADNSLLNDTLAGITITSAADTGDDDWLVINGADVYVHQQNTGGSATGTAAGVFMNVGGIGCTLKILNSNIHVVNDAGGSNAYSLYASTAPSTILHGSVFSDQATDDNSGTGTITALTALT